MDTYVRKCPVSDFLKKCPAIVDTYRTVVTYDEIPNVSTQRRTNT
ncbi:MAG: hypothetical protein NTZ39_07605 [Methanoregula sp.]|nr:hypothetical protein [Methanoregula sp.]